ncbi:MAG: hypothetical protein ACK5KP_10505 [Paludibacteraceae bacterium]
MKNYLSFILFISLFLSLSCSNEEVPNIEEVTNVEVNPIIGFSTQPLPMNEVIAISDKLRDLNLVNPTQMAKGLYKKGMKI